MVATSSLLILVLGKHWAQRPRMLSVRKASEHQAIRSV